MKMEGKKLVLTVVGKLVKAEAGLEGKQKQTEIKKGLRLLIAQEKEQKGETKEHETVRPVHDSARQERKQ